MYVKDVPVNPIITCHECMSFSCLNELKRMISDDF